MLYFALDKKTGEIIRGARGQIVFPDESYLCRSLGNKLAREASKKGVKPSDLYIIRSIAEEQVIHMSEGNGKEFKVVEHLRKFDDKLGLDISVTVDGVPTALLQFHESFLQEDNTLQGAFKDVYCISPLLLLAYDAGRAGMEFNFILESDNVE